MEVIEYKRWVSNLLTILDSQHLTLPQGMLGKLWLPCILSQFSTGCQWKRDTWFYFPLTVKFSLMFLNTWAKAYVFPRWHSHKEYTCQCRDARDVSLIPGSWRSSGGLDGNLLQYSCLGNPMDRGAWWVPVHGVTESKKRLSMQHTQVHIDTHTHKGTYIVLEQFRNAVPSYGVIQS